jgi:hypothetical protein
MAMMLATHVQLVAEVLSADEQASGHVMRAIAGRDREVLRPRQPPGRVSAFGGGARPDRSTSGC